MPGLRDQSLKLNPYMGVYRLEIVRDFLLMVINCQCTARHTSIFPKKTKKLNMHSGPTDQKGKRWSLKEPQPIGLHGKKHPHFEKAHQV